jgi:hypothetical protein
MAIPLQQSKVIDFVIRIFFISVQEHFGAILAAGEIGL